MLSLPRPPKSELLRTLPVTVSLPAPVLTCSKLDAWPVPALTVRFLLDAMPASTSRLTVTLSVWPEKSRRSLRPALSASKM